MTAILTFTGVIFSLGLALFFPYLVDAKQQQQQILSATVMITITTPNWQEEAGAVDEALPIPNDEYRSIARAEGDVLTDGLGTLVVEGQSLLLVTHDHWSHLDETLGTVTFRAADGTWLADMQLRDFKERIRSRDGGIMVLDAPNGLKTTVPVEATDPHSNALQAGDRGFLAQREGGRVTVTEATVIARAEKEGRPIVRLQSVDGQAVVGGDSGGGLWVNGRLAATMWTTVVLEYETSGTQQATDMSIAAVYQGMPG